MPLANLFMRYLLYFAIIQTAYFESFGNDFSSVQTLSKHLICFHMF